MADKKVMMSDLSDQMADVRLQWALGTKRYVIDLTNDEHAKFEEQLKPYIEASRTPARRKRRATARKGGKAAT